MMQHSSTTNYIPSARAKKSLGQHFLTDQNIIRKIIALLNVEQGDAVLEIGPGTGALTSELRTLPWNQLILLEKDDYYAAEHAARPMKGLSVIHGDALSYPWRDLKGSWKIIGNLPYNIASPLIWEIVLLQNIKAAVFMVQKEVGGRILASPGTKDYGALSVWIQSFVTPYKGFYVPPSAFSPPPKVDSAVLYFSPLPKEQRPNSPDTLRQILNICFKQRRKQLQSILRHEKIPSFDPSVFTRINISGEQRPETLTPKQFQLLGKILFENSPQ